MAETWTTPKTWDYKEAPGSDSFNEQVRDNLKYLKESLPAGIIFGYGGGSAPDQWLICNGAAISRSTYSALFAAISTSYGVGNGSTTFNLPDYRGKVMAGYDSTDADFDSIGKTFGSKTVSIAHTHTGPSHTHSGTTNQASAEVSAESGTSKRTDIYHVHTFTTGAAGTGNTGAMSANATPSIIQPGQVSNFIIKY